MTVRSTTLGTPGYLALLGWTLVLTAILPDGLVWPLLVGLLALGRLERRSGLTVLRSRSLWLFTLSLPLLAALFLAEQDASLGALGYSRSGLWMGLGMSARALVMVVAFSISVGSLSVGQLMELFRGLGRPGPGLALGVALNLGPILRETVEAAYHTLRLRGGFRRPILALRLFLITVVSNTLRYGDDVVNSAAARAFDPTSRPAEGGLVLSGADRAFIMGLAVTGTIMILLGRIVFC